MSEISRFLGIVIAMFYRDHGPAHFHARYGEYKASVDFSGDVVVGWLPQRALRFVEEWARVHAEELQANWNRARDKQALLPIEPLA